MHKYDRMFAESIELLGQTTLATRCPEIHNADERRHSATASGRPGRDTLACADINLLLVLTRCVAHALFDLPGHCQESLFDVRRVLRRGLEEWNTKAVGKFLECC